MTPEEFLAKSDTRQLAWAVGPGLPLAAAAAIGISLADDSWYGLADEVLKTAMTPVSVLAAASIVLLTGALAGKKPGGGQANDRSEAVTLVSIVYVLLTTLYFTASLATLSVPDGAAAKDDLVNTSFALLGSVLGSMIAVAVLLALWRHDAAAGDTPESDPAGDSAGVQAGTEAAGRTVPPAQNSDYDGGAETGEAG